MLFTWVPALGRHIITQYVKGIFFLLLMFSVYCGLPFTAIQLHQTAIARVQEPHTALLVDRWYWTYILSAILALFGNELQALQYLRKTSSASIESRAMRLFKELVKRGELRCHPVLLYHDTEGLQANVGGSFLFGKKVILSPGMLNFPDKKLQSIMAHELGHLMNRDTVLSFLIYVMHMTLKIYLSAVLISLLFFLGHSMWMDAWHAEVASFLGLFTAIMLIGFCLFTFAELASSRAREYLADAAGIALIGWDSREMFAIALEETFIGRHIGITAETLGVMMRNEGEPWFELDDAFRTHPSIRNRIAVLLGP